MAAGLLLDLSPPPAHARATMRLPQVHPLAVRKIEIAPIATIDEAFPVVLRVYG